MSQRKAKKILKEVVTSYEKIGEEFDRTRQIPVKEFELFRKHIKPGAYIADLGCGNGRLLKSLGTFSRHYLGIDNSETMLKTAKKNFPGHNFINGDQLKIPVADGIMDIVFNIRAFHHLPSKKLRLQALSEMNRILRPNGILIITVWNLWQPKYRNLALRACLRFLYTLGGYSWNDFFVPWGKTVKRYYHAFTPLELNNLVTDSGFEIEELYAVRDGIIVPLKESHDIVIIARKNNNV